MITPVNGHLIIEPIAQDAFVATADDKYQEIGIVVEASEDIWDIDIVGDLEIGDKVYFDAWLAKKYPKAGGKPGDFLWVVKWEHISAVEYAERKVSE